MSKGNDGASYINEDGAVNAGNDLQNYHKINVDYDEKNKEKSAFFSSFFLAF